jgi:hypothetical protein
MGYVQNEMEKAVGKKWAKRFGIVGGIIVIYLIVSSVFSIYPFSVAKGVATKVVNAERIIYNYQWYYDQYNAILAQKANIDSMDKNATELSGMKMVLNNAIAEYNSKSKQITRNLWKASDLPYQIELGGIK